MPAFLVTGNPGSGKSALAQELARRGLATIDPDHDPELSYWEDDAGNQVLFVDGPPAPDRDREWLRAHHWVWSRSRMEDLLGQQDGPVFVCGIALNLDQFLDLFDQVFLLQIDEATQEARTNPSATMWCEDEYIGKVGISAAIGERAGEANHPPAALFIGTHYPPGGPDLLFDNVPGTPPGPIRHSGQKSPNDIHVDTGLVVVQFVNRRSLHGGPI